MKTLLFFIPLFTAASLYSAALPTTIVGGGTDYLTIDDTVDPALCTVNTGTTNKYAGIEGGTITYTFKENVPGPTPPAAIEKISAFTINENFHIKSTININYDAPSGYSSRNEFVFTIASGKTLIIDRLNITTQSTSNANYLVFSGSGNVTYNTSGT